MKINSTILFISLLFLVSCKSDKSSNTEKNVIRVCTEKIDYQIDLSYTLISDKTYLSNQAPISYAAEYVPYRWKKNVLKVSFLNGDKDIQTKIIKSAKKWEINTNIKLEFGNHLDPDITINIDDSQDSWSHIGSQSKLNKPSINFGWLTAETEDKEYDRVVLHEFGHALGLIHEHQHPEANINWDSLAVFKHYEGKWSKKKVRSNIIQKYNYGEINHTEFDENSIMTYAIPNSWTNDDYSINWNTKLSKNDIALIKSIYKK